AIEQDADMVMFLYRPEYYGINNDEMGTPLEGETHIHIAKHRNGSTDTVKVRFIKEYQKFVDIEDGIGFHRAPTTQNPMAGFPNTRSGDFGNSAMFIDTNSFQTLPSRMNDIDYDDDDDDDDIHPPKGPEEEADF